MFNLNRKINCISVFKLQNEFSLPFLTQLFCYEKYVEKFLLYEIIQPQLYCTYNSE